MTPSPPIPKFLLQSAAACCGVKMGSLEFLLSTKIKSFPKPSNLENATIGTSERVDAFTLKMFVLVWGNVVKLNADVSDKNFKTANK